MNSFSLKIDRNEVLRYLGYKDQVLSDEMNNTIDKCREEIKGIITPRATYMHRYIQVLDDGVNVLETNLVLKGNDIKKLLKNSKECVLMAVTLGNNIEKRTRLYEKTNLTKALILDACATTAIEEVCDAVEADIRKEANVRNKSITYRYSPGYGDLSLEIQNDFLEVLEAQKRIGLIASENNLLFPRKSVTAIIGIIDKNIKINKKNCKDCSNYNNCSFRREGETCGA